MKIAVFHNLPLGGGKRALFEEVKFLSSTHEIHLYETEKQDKFLDANKYSNKNYMFDFSLNNHFPGILTRLYKDYMNFYRLSKHHKNIAEIIDSGNYDVSLIHPDKFTQAPFILKHLKTPALYFCEEYLRMCYEDQLRFKEKVPAHYKLYENTTRQIRKKIDKKNARCATKVLANSKFTKRNIDKAYGIVSGICHLGVDEDVFHNISGKKRDNVLVIGEKNITNDYAMINDLSGSIENYGLKIKTLGFSKGKLAVSDDNILAEEYSGAQTTLCLSYNEPFGLAPLESMACETPVLAVDEGGYKETVIDGVTGYLLPRDPRVFAKKIKYLIDNPEIVRKMGKAGRKHVKRQFSWKKHCKCLEKYLVEIAEDKKHL